jgi:hypothetical protein
MRPPHVMRSWTMDHLSPRAPDYKSWGSVENNESVAVSWRRSSNWVNDGIESAINATPELKSRHDIAFTTSCTQLELNPEVEPQELAHLLMLWDGG